jgi:hypothetical protein
MQALMVETVVNVGVPSENDNRASKDDGKKQRVSAASRALDGYLETLKAGGVSVSEQAFMQCSVCLRCKKK